MVIQQDYKIFMILTKILSQILLHSSNDHTMVQGGNVCKALNVGLAHGCLININCYYDLWQIFSL